MQRTNIYLQARQTEKLDRLATAEGISRAELIRRLVDRGLNDADDLTADLAAIDASLGGATEREFLSRGEDDCSRHLADGWNTARASSKAMC